MTQRWQQGHDMDLKHGKEMHLPYSEDLPRRFCISKLLYFATRSRLCEANRRRHRSIFRTCNAGRSHAYATNSRDTPFLIDSGSSEMYPCATEVSLDVKRHDTDILIFSGTLYSAILIYSDISWNSRWNSAILKCHRCHSLSCQVLRKSLFESMSALKQTSAITETTVQELFHSTSSLLSWHEEFATCLLYLAAPLVLEQLTTS